MVSGKIFKNHPKKRIVIPKMAASPKHGNTDQPLLPIKLYGNDSLPARSWIHIANQMKWNNDGFIFKISQVLQKSFSNSSTRFSSSIVLKIRGQKN